MDLGNKEENRIQTRLTDANSQFKNLKKNEQFQKQEVTRENKRRKKKKS